MCEIGKLTEFDVKEHALETVINRSYQSSTLNQFLGQLERVNAAESIMPALIPEESGDIYYIDGHMIVFWTGASMVYAQRQDNNVRKDYAGIECRYIS